MNDGKCVQCKKDLPMVQSPGCAPFQGDWSDVTMTIHSPGGISAAEVTYTVRLLPENPPGARGKLCRKCMLEILHNGLKMPVWRDT